MTKKERSWVLYDWANSAFTLIIMTTIMPLFYKEFLSVGIKAYDATAYLGYANSIYGLILAVLAPILGTIADYKNNKKKFFLTFFLMGVSFTFLLTFLATGQWLLCLILYIIAAIGFSGANIFYDSFITDVTTSDKMDWLSSNGFAWGYLGSTIPFIMSIIVYIKYEWFGIPSEFLAIKISFIITTLWWVIFSIPMIKNVKQVYYVEKKGNPVKNSFKRLIDFFKRIKDYKNIAFFLLAYFFYIDGVHTIIKMAVSFAKDIANMPMSSLLFLLLAIQFIAFPFALLFGKLAGKFSAKTMIIFGISIYIAITFLAYFATSAIHIWILGGLVAVAQGGIQSLSRSLYGKIIPKTRSGEYFGFYNIVGKAAAILGPTLMGVMSQIFENSRIGVFSLLILFLAGGSFLIKVDENKKVVVNHN